MRRTACLCSAETEVEGMSMNDMIHINLHLRAATL